MLRIRWLIWVSQSVTRIVWTSVLSPLGERITRDRYLAVVPGRSNRSSISRFLVVKTVR